MQSCCVVQIVLTPKGIANCVHVILFKFIFRLFESYVCNVHSIYWLTFYFWEKQVFHIMSSSRVSNQSLLVSGSYVSKQVKVQFEKETY